MTSKLEVSPGSVRAYWELFVNRLAHTLQMRPPHTDAGRYYRPLQHGEPVPLSLDTIRRHLEGDLTFGLYAINPKTQRCRWVAIDADYDTALEDLLTLQWELRKDGVEAALERSRRGGHLWIFAAEPLLARDCRVYIYNLAVRLKVPVKRGGLAAGIEIFPKQDTLKPNEFGNALRGPLGVHQAAQKRYWFYGADYNFTDQLGYLARLRKITAAEMQNFVRGLDMPPEFQPPKIEPRLYRPPADGRNEFRILDHVKVRRRRGQDYWTQCPSCAQQGRDKSRDNLAISIVKPTMYKCWAGCSVAMIRAALGFPVRRSGTR